MIGFTDGANDVLADLCARRSEGEPAGGFERPADILDWSYASSPFCAALQAEREFSADFAHKSLDVANDNARVRLVR